MPVPSLPRSVIAALWLPAVADLGAAHRATKAVEGDDEPHVAVLGRAQLNWPALIARLAPVRAVVAALPVPGDPAGVPAPVAAAAIEAGECVLVSGREGDWALVPQVHRFGSHLEPGASVSWQVTALPSGGRPLGAGLATLPEARMNLVDALASATATLTRMDLARTSPEAAGRLADLGDGAGRWPLPPEIDAPRLDLLARSAWLLAVVALARQDDGAAVTAVQVGARGAALTEVERAARQAMSAATLTRGP